MKANQRGRRLPDDDAGVAFAIVEAILVAVLVLTAIIFFTSIQRPSTSAQEGGLDLAQLAADTLQLLESRTFNVPDASGVDAPYQGTAVTYPQWMTNLAIGDEETAAQVDVFMGDILPAGTLYHLRLNNGVSSLTLLPLGGDRAPIAARGSEVAFVPAWAANVLSHPTFIVRPGEIVAAAPALGLVDLSAAYGCLRSPLGFTTMPDLGDGGTAPDTWIAHWKATPPVEGRQTQPVPWKAKQLQVPLDAPYGTWIAYNNAGCSTGATPFKVLPPADQSRIITVTINGGSLDTLVSAAFTAGDVGKPVEGQGIPGGARITAVNAGTSATMSANGLAAANFPASVGHTSPYPAYGLQLVVWFGA